MMHEYMRILIENEKPVNDIKKRHLDYFLIRRAIADPSAAYNYRTLLLVSLYDFLAKKSGQNAQDVALDLDGNDMLRLIGDL